jgi:hypothetical protein
VRPYLENKVKVKKKKKTGDMPQEVEQAGGAEFKPQKQTNKQKQNPVLSSTSDPLVGKEDFMTSWIV